MNITKTLVTVQESILGGTWSFTVKIDDGNAQWAYIPSQMGYRTLEEAKEAGDQYAVKITELNQ